MEDVQHKNINTDNLFPLNIDDPRNWDEIGWNMQDFLVEKFPPRIDVILFPKDSTGRHCDALYYKQLIQNGETSDRKWLVYSISLDKVFCFCGKLFKTESVMNKIG